MNGAPDNKKLSPSLFTPAEAGAYTRGWKPLAKARERASNNRCSAANVTSGLFLWLARSPFDRLTAPSSVEGL